jgi:hypothetical protein
MVLDFFKKYKHKIKIFYPFNDFLNRLATVTNSLINLSARFIKFVISSFLGFKTDFSNTRHLDTAAPYKKMSKKLYFFLILTAIVSSKKTNCSSGFEWSSK